MAEMTREDAIAKFETLMNNMRALGIDPSEFDISDDDGEDFVEKPRPQQDAWGPVGWMINDPELKQKFEYIFTQMGMGFLNDYEFYQVTNLVMIALEFVKLQDHYNRLADILQEKLERGEYRDEKDRKTMIKKIEKYKRVDLKPLVELVLSPAISILKVSGSRKGVLPKLMHTSIQKVEQKMVENEKKSERRLTFPTFMGGGEREW